MKSRSSTGTQWLAIFAAALALFAGCGKKDDPIAQAAKKDVAKGVSAPSIAEVKAIAEEGFIFGLPRAAIIAFVLLRSSIAARSIVL